MQTFIAEATQIAGKLDDKKMLIIIRAKSTATRVAGGC